MSVKRPYEDDVSDELEEKIKRAKAAPDSRKKHSLDSDEEDSDGEEKAHYQIMGEDDIEGQEDGVVGMDGETKLTPFNMKEEMEEGHFDADGNYHWDKEKVIKDHWLDNIDWVKIKNRDKNSADDNSESTPASPFDKREIYREILTYMVPGETVGKALRRLGSVKTLSASERLKRRKAGLSIETNESQGQKVTELTELANRLLTKTGNMDIYQETFEFIKNLTEQSSSGESSKAKISTDASLDMYADDFDEKEKKLIEKKDVQPTETHFGVTLMWEYKSTKDGEKIEGPYTSEQMQTNIINGTIKGEIWVRKVGEETQFYSSKRIDFDLYT